MRWLPLEDAARWEPELRGDPYLRPQLVRIRDAPRASQITRGVRAPNRTDMIGLKSGTVELAPHAEEWHQLFAQEEARLRDAVGEHVTAIEHVGSTSICGISAKPIIDIAVGVRELADAEKCVRPLEEMGYEYRGENGIPGRYYFIKGEPRTHHLHMVELDSELWKNHLLFRDYLRRCPEVV